MVASRSLPGQQQVFPFLGTHVSSIGFLATQGKPMEPIGMRAFGLSLPHRWMDRGQMVHTTASK